MKILRVLSIIKVFDTGTDLLKFATSLLFLSSKHVLDKEKVIQKRFWAVLSFKKKFVQFQNFQFFNLKSSDLSDFFLKRQTVWDFGCELG